MIYSLILLILYCAYWLHGCSGLHIPLTRFLLLDGEEMQKCTLRGSQTCAFLGPGPTLDRCEGCVRNGICAKANTQIHPPKKYLIHPSKKYLILYFALVLQLETERSV